MVIVDSKRHSSQLMTLMRDGGGRRPAGLMFSMVLSLTHRWLAEGLEFLIQKARLSHVARGVSMKLECIGKDSELEKPFWWLGMS